MKQNIRQHNLAPCSLIQHLCVYMMTKNAKYRQLSSVLIQSQWHIVEFSISLYDYHIRNLEEKKKRSN